MEERPPILRVAVNILNKQWRIADKVWSSSIIFGRDANNPYRKNVFCYEMFNQKYSDPDSGNCKCVNGPTGSIKFGEFLD
jgi:hypothetical protein